jgi:hypothetical protein
MMSTDTDITVYICGDVSHDAPLASDRFAIHAASVDRIGDGRSKHSLHP